MDRNLQENLLLHPNLHILRTIYFLVLIRIKKKITVSSFCNLFTMWKIFHCFLSYKLMQNMRGNVKKIKSTPFQIAIDS